MKSRHWRPWMGVVVLWGMAFSLSCRLSGPIRDSAERRSGRSAADAMAGGARVALGDACYAQADVFFHRGVPHKHKKAIEDDWFQRLAEEVRPAAHVHLGGKSIREMLPWLWFAIRANPRNTEFYLVASYWLAGDAGRPDLAHEVLREALNNNPADCEVRLEQSRLFLREGKTAEARRALNVGLTLWPGVLSADTEDAKMLRRNLLLHSAFLAESKGDTARALKDLNGLLEMFPDMLPVRERIKALESGQNPAGTAADMLKNLIEENRRSKETCGREEENHAE